MIEHRPNALADYTEKVHYKQELLRLSEKIKQSIAVSALATRQRNSELIKGKQLYGKVKRSIEVRTKFFCEEQELLHGESVQSKVTHNAKGDTTLTIDTLTTNQMDRHVTKLQLPKHEKQTGVTYSRTAERGASSLDKTITVDYEHQHSRTELNQQLEVRRPKLLEISSRYKTVDKPNRNVRERAKRSSIDVPYILQSRSKKDKKKYDMINRTSQRQLDRISFEMSFIEKAEHRLKDSGIRKSNAGPIFLEGPMRSMSRPLCLSVLNTGNPLEVLSHI